MSQPRRRRRRGRRGGQGSGGQPKQEATRNPVEGQSSERTERSGRSRRRRGRSRSGSVREASSPRSSEDLVRALPRERPETLTAPPDGQTLEAIIGDLQSTWGVPPYPQEYRITVKVAEDRDHRPDGSAGGNGAPEKPHHGGASQPTREKASGGNAQPRREKAPAAPGVASGGAQRGAAPKKRRRRRRRGGGGDGTSSPQSALDPAPGGAGSEQGEAPRASDAADPGSAG